MNRDFKRLWRLVVRQSLSPIHTIHGPDHWRRVERNGLLLATRSGADVDVVRLFALFHDSQRMNDGTDPGHGARGADYAKTLLGTAYELEPARFNLLYDACARHTDGECHENPTIGTCWDADRLDLGRVGIHPHQRYMSTDFGREIATRGSIEPFLRNGANT